MYNVCGWFPSHLKLNVWPTWLVDQDSPDSNVLLRLGALISWLLILVWLGSDPRSHNCASCHAHVAWHDAQLLELGIRFHNAFNWMSARGLGLLWESIHLSVLLFLLKKMDVILLIFSHHVYLVFLDCKPSGLWIIFTMYMYTPSTTGTQFQ